MSIPAGPYKGMNIGDIPENEFMEGFDPDERYPALVLASVLRVPADADNNWRLATEDCGGFACYTLDAAVLPLSIKPEMQNVLADIVDEKFSDSDLDYYSVMMSPEERLQVQNNYLECLQAAGLTCDSEYITLLQQALYPVDATPENIQRLTTDNIGVQLTNELVLFIVGQNCD
ncbi:TPA: hypothetical protein LVM22_001188 [Klebsiella oxytoca]|nr:hypothetical protein [Klebsiella oxytoca]